MARSSRRLYGAARRARRRGAARRGPIGYARRAARRRVLWGSVIALRGLYRFLRRR